MNENSQWLRERRRQEQEAAERLYAEEAAAEAPAAAGAAAEAAQPQSASEDPRAARAQRSCSICVAAGLTAEAKGHISVGHDSWLRRQPAHVQAHFNGQAAPEDLTPRLVRRPADSDD